jgi:uncharacterized protein YndB with AHSA1/START domain
LTGKTTGRTDVSTGRFLSLAPGKRIVQSVEFESADASFAGEMTMAWSFEALPAGTRVTVTAENVPRGIHLRHRQQPAPRALAIGLHTVLQLHELLN